MLRERIIVLFDDAFCFLFPTVQVVVRVCLCCCINSPVIISQTKLSHSVLSISCSSGQALDVRCVPHTKKDAHSAVLLAERSGVTARDCSTSQ